MGDFRLLSLTTQRVASTKERPIWLHISWVCWKLPGDGPADLLKPRRRARVHVVCSSNVTGDAGDQGFMNIHQFDGNILLSAGASPELSNWDLFGISFESKVHMIRIEHLMFRSVGSREIRDLEAVKGNQHLGGIPSRSPDRMTQWYGGCPKSLHIASTGTMAPKSFP